MVLELGKKRQTDEPIISGDDTAYQYGASLKWMRPSWRIVSMSRCVSSWGVCLCCARCMRSKLERSVSSPSPGMTAFQRVVLPGAATRCWPTPRWVSSCFSANNIHHSEETNTQQLVVSSDGTGKGQLIQSVKRLTSFLLSHSLLSSSHHGTQWTLGEYLALLSPSVDPVKLLTFYNSLRG
ncbi:hypothetical protein VP01_1266g1 [Puccinia sorghi]|uniref:Uncharacterized protein n=1 Tax=Puccinia sorghi TaxID=27349 RepID=A0A0L6VP30_9BASI|nr:hypothetical protein VP01_1266g1 [Puccinia sorghi]